MKRSSQVMSRFVLIFKGKKEKPKKDVVRIRGLDDLTVLDDSLPQMLLVDAPRAELEELVEDMPDWTMTPVKKYAIPQPRPKVRKSSLKLPARLPK